MSKKVSRGWLPDSVTEKHVLSRIVVDRLYRTKKICCLCQPTFKPKVTRFKITVIVEKENTNG